MRQVHGHEGSGLNSKLQVFADERDESGGSHGYDISSHEGETGTLGTIQFQQGPLLEAGLNGMSDEVLIAIVIDRLEGFQTGPYRSRHNALAITKLEEALHWLNARTKDRETRGVEGTSAV